MIYGHKCVTWSLTCFEKADDEAVTAAMRWLWFAVAEDDDAEPEDTAEPEEALCPESCLART